MRSLFTALLIIGIFTGCNQEKKHAPEAETLPPPKPSFDKDLRKFTRAPNIPRMNYDRDLLAVYFDFTELYDSTSIAMFDGKVQEAYMFHLMQYASEHPDYTLVSESTSTDSAGKEVGHYTFWKRTMKRRSGQAATVVSN